MANVINQGTFHPRRVNQYVRAMQYSSDVNYGGRTRISFGAVAAAATTNVVANQATAAAISLDLTGLVSVPEPWGRAVTLTGNASVTAGSAVTLRGFDYLNQPMSEVFTTVAGVTPVVGLRAFKSFQSVTFALNAAGSIMSIGYNNKLGLPFRAIAQSVETANSVPTATQGTFVAGPFAQTSNAAGQPDPRGTYLPNTVPNASTVITASFDFANDLSGQNCGLMGFPHAG